MQFDSYYKSFYDTFYHFTSPGNYLNLGRGLERRYTRVWSEKEKLTTEHLIRKQVKQMAVTDPTYKKDIKYEIVTPRMINYAV